MYRTLDEGDADVVQTKRSQFRTTRGGGRDEKPRDEMRHDGGRRNEAGYKA